MHRVLLCVLAAFGIVVSSALVATAQQHVGEGAKSGTKVVVRSLQRDDGGTVTLRFQIVSERPKAETIYSLLGGYLDDRVHLLDAANKKKYLVIKDSSGKCECTQVRGSVAKDEPANLWARFPAPPTTVQKITVVVDGFEPVDSVPLTTP